MRVHPDSARPFNPAMGAPYLAVNSSNDSSECASFFLATDWENERWAVHAIGVAWYIGTRTPTRLNFDAARMKDIVGVN